MADYNLGFNFYNKGRIINQLPKPETASNDDPSV